MMRKILKSSLSSRALFVWATSAILAPVLIQNSSIAQPARAWGPGETPTQAANRVVTDEQIVNINGIDKEVKKGEVINFEGGEVNVERGKEAVLQSGTRILKDGTVIFPDGTARTADGTTVLPDGRAVVEADQGKETQGIQQGKDTQGVTQGIRGVRGDGFDATISCTLGVDETDIIVRVDPLNSLNSTGSVVFGTRNLVLSFNTGAPVPKAGVIVPQSVAYAELIMVPGRKSAVNIAGTVGAVRSTSQTLVTVIEYIIRPSALTTTCN
jgi:hypothetical protein